MALLHFDDVGSILHVQFFSSGKTLFSEHGIAKIQLNSLMHASEWAQIGVKLVLFQRKKWCRWCGKPFGIISEHNFLWKIFTFLTPSRIFSKSGTIQIPIGGQNLGVSYLEIYVELRDFTSGAFFHILRSSVRIHCQMDPIDRFTPVSRHTHFRQISLFGPPEFSLSPAPYKKMKML